MESPWYHTVGFFIKTTFIMSQETVSERLYRIKKQLIRKLKTRCLFTLDECRAVDKPGALPPFKNMDFRFLPVVTVHKGKNHEHEVRIVGYDVSRTAFLCYSEKHDSVSQYGLEHGEFTLEAIARLYDALNK